MKRQRAWLVLFGLLVLGGLARAQLEALPTITISARFGQWPEDLMVDLLDGALELVPMDLNPEMAAQVGELRVYRGSIESLQRKLDATPGAALEPGPTIRTRSGEAAEISIGEQLPARLLLPGLVYDQPGEPVEVVQLDVPMRIAATPYLAVDDPTALSAVLIETELGTLIGQLGEGAAQVPITAKMAFTTLFDFSDVDIDTYLLAWRPEPEGAPVKVMVFTVGTQQP